MPRQRDAAGPLHQYFDRRCALNKVAVTGVIVGSLLAGALYTWFAGEDVNWDWRSYHEYGAFALLNGRFNIDVAPGGHETFLNPLAYVPAYLLRHMFRRLPWDARQARLHWPRRP